MKLERIAPDYADMEQPSPRRRAKEAYVIADTLKVGAFDSSESLAASLQEVKQDIASRSEEKIDAYIGGQNPPRLDFFNRAEWELGTVDLSKCTVWNKMGERPWAIGFVTAVAKAFRAYEPQGSRIWSMEKFSEMFFSHLPIIVFITGASTFAIDDGSHRAVAMVLAGRNLASAWIGRL